MATIDSKQDLQTPIGGTRKTRLNKFFAFNPNGDALFAGNADIDLTDSLEQASTFLSAAEQVVRNLAMMNGGNESAFAALYLVEMSRALVDASIHASIVEGGAA